MSVRHTKYTGIGCKSNENTDKLNKEASTFIEIFFLRILTGNAFI